MAHGFSCPAACGILVPWLGIEPVSSALQGGFFTTGPPGKSLTITLDMLHCNVFLCRLVSPLTMSFLRSDTKSYFHFPSIRENAGTVGA